VLLQHNGDMQHGNGADYAKGPRYIEILQGRLHSSNLLRIRIRADLGRRGGLAPMVLGPDEEVHPLYLSNYRWRSTGSFAVIILGLLMGFMAMMLWATQVDATVPTEPRRDPLYLYAGLAELFWTINVSDAILENPPLSWPWWGMVTLLSAAIWVASMAFFCIEVAGWSKRPATSWMRRWLALMLVGSVVAAVGALVLGHPAVLTLWYAGLVVTVMVLFPALTWKAFHGGALSLKLTTAALLLNGVVGIRDLIVFRINPVYGENTFLRYSSVLFGLTLGYIVIRRFRTATARARDLTANLAQRVAQKEDELLQTYQRVEQLAREQERTAERARILRDMHDGVGSHISTAIRQLETGRASSAQVLQTLRDSLDQLKLSVDALNLPPGDIGGLLANIRYRLEPRFSALDIHLIWEVDELEPVLRLDGAAMRQLQFMLFEALSNVLQHAHARSLRIRAQPMRLGSPAVKLQIIDDGVGFDVNAPVKRGLRSMAERASAIGAVLLWSSAPGQTVVEISLA
jgi:signal transduction histidine kinase